MEYYMTLHEDQTLFRQSVQFTADQLQLPAIYVEKDYWVTYALFSIFSNPIGKDTVFKGGTALSKCYKIIERFSEDIDLVILRREGETDGMLKSKLKEISNVVSASLPEVDVEGITRKMGMNRKTAHSYKKEFNADFGQIRDVIIVESSWLGYHEPFTTININSFVGQMILNGKQPEIADSHRLLPFKIAALHPTRTICEKIMSLVRFSYSKDPIENFKSKIRHTYDLHQLLQGEYVEFLQSEEFDKMLLKVANDDVASFRNNNEWLDHHPNQSLFFGDLDNIWKMIKGTFTGEFKNLVYGQLPDEQEVLKTLKMIRARMGEIHWTIKVEPEK
jgi:Nucleotidyl transferase AbiEii toxin, Type IV TA system